MNYLLDTHSLIWWFFDDPKLSPLAREIIGDRRNEIAVSSASAWEIATKYRLGRLAGVEPLLTDLTGWLRRAGFVELPIGIEHARKAGSWAHEHRDPFDRVIAAQSIMESAPLITRDRAIPVFGVSVIW